MKKTLSRLPRVVRLAALSAVLLALCSKSSPLYAFNDWMDANIFFTMGRSMLGGRVLYRDVFDHKGPVLYLLYGLAGLIGGTDFRGVLVLEIIAMTSFLYTGLRTAELLAGRRLSVWWMALPAAGMAASRAFSHGGSAEELLLPFLAAALYGLVKCLTANRQMPLRTVALQGFLCGCALLLKYTVLGFYLAWVAVLAVLYLRRGWLRQLGRSCAAYLGGLALAALPWFAYFGAYHALDAWWECYFYDNLFLYKGDGRSALPLAQHLWWAVRDDLPAVWRQNKRKDAQWLAARLREQAALRPEGSGPLRVLSIGSGVGYMEHCLVEEMSADELELHVNEPSTVSMRWLRRHVPNERMYIGMPPACLPPDVFYDVIYLSAVDYSIPTRELQHLLGELRAQLVPGGQLICLSASLLQEDSFIGSFVNALKIVIRGFLHFLGIRRQQFWGWRRTRDEYRELLRKADFRHLEDGWLEDGFETYWIRGC